MRLRHFALVLSLVAVTSATPSRLDALAPAAARSASAVPFDSGHVTVSPGIALYYRVLGGAHRDTIVFVHGGPGLSASYLENDLDFLAAKHTVVLYDQRGSGRSTLISDSSQVSVALHVADLDAVLAHFHIGHANLYGHSWGAGLVANYVAAHPATVRKAILGSSIPPRRVPYMAQFSAKLTAWADSATKARITALSRAQRNAADPVAACRAYWAVFITGYYADTSAIKRMKSDVCANPPASLSNRVNAWTLGPLGDWDWRTLLATTTVPILVLHGTGDPIPMESAKEWAANIRGASLVALDGAGHWPMVERPVQLLAAMERFYFGAGK
ncbi:MAG: alpha/beta hydrolase [Gemmatimonadaceae bacterium]|jgi:proline iminopeptidase